MTGITIVNQSPESMHLVGVFRAQDGSRVVKLGAGQIPLNHCEVAAAFAKAEKLTWCEPYGDAGTTPEATDGDLDGN